MTPAYTVYALLIGINTYPNPRNSLQGCVADVGAIQEYLQTFCLDNKLELKVVTLINEAATRDGIINGFEHFQAATDDDFCLFHYSGHGSRSLAPREFLHLESDGYIESLACYDSRTANGRDLMNKELSWLIWNTTKAKPNLQFISIMDCCHSGRVTRSSGEKEEKVRTIDPSDKKFKPNTILGFEDYNVDEDSRYTPPHGRQILLAAARDKQKAKEVKAKGIKRGVFSYFIIDKLKQYKGKLTYGELINHISAPVKNCVSDQVPQIVTTISHDQRNYFLSKEIKSNKQTRLLSWNKKGKEWRINIGQLQGVLVGIENELPQFKLLKNNVIIACSAVHTDYTVMTITDDLDKNKSYQVEQILSNKLVYINHQTTTKAIRELIKMVSEHTTSLIELTNDRSKADYQIITQNNQWIFQAYNEAQTFSKTIFSISENFEHVKIFQNRISTYFNWLRVLQIQNPNSQILDNVLSIDFHKIAENKRETISIENNKTVVEFDCTQKNGQWLIPKFQLQIQNSNSQLFWVSVCYLGADYSIQNHLVDIQDLLLNKSINARQVDNNSFLNKEIELSIPKEILKNDAKEIKVYLKIFIGKQAFSTDMLNQKGIYDKASIKRLPKKLIIIPDDWTTKEIQINLKKIK